MRQRPVVLSFVEDGWESARMLAIGGVEQCGWRVRHLIKGTVAPEVLAMVTPYPGMSLVSIPRAWFRVVVGCVLLCRLMARRLSFVIVDNPRTRGWVSWCARRWQVPVVEAQERFRQLRYLCGQQVVDRETALRHLSDGTPSA